jgi:hypothetical protein
MTRVNNRTGAYSSLRHGMLIVILVIFISVNLHAGQPEFRKYSGATWFYPVTDPLS